jgi:MYXO-CTERM domain-containing protein
LKRALLLPPLLSACEPTDLERTAVTRGPIIGGSADGNDPAVVLLASYSPDHSILYFCTATVIAPDVLLTAAHCVDEANHPSFTFGVFTGPDANDYTEVADLAPELLAVSEVRPHPSYDTAAPFTADIALVRMAEPLSIEPLAIAWEPLPEDIAGREARIVGYGQIVYEQSNAAKYSATTVVAAVDAGDTITVGDAQHRSCIGDSGGPALVIIDGVETLVGVNSYTDMAGCLEPAHYRRVDQYADFIAELVDPPAPPPPSDGGSDAGGAGAGGDDAAGGAAADDDDAEDGCAVSREAPHGGFGVAALLLLGASAVLRRRRPISRA